MIFFKKVALSCPCSSEHNSFLELLSTAALSKKVALDTFKKHSSSNMGIYSYEIPEASHVMPQSVVDFT